MRFVNIRTLTMGAKNCWSHRNFVPKHKPVSDSDVKRLEDFLRPQRNLFVLTGAGVSTESGIPDYRSADVGLYATSTRRPVEMYEFVKSRARRQLYWARNYAAWTKFSTIEPNATHLALARWQHDNRIHCIVTQNVDRLHQKAGSKDVIEIHGSGYTVICLSCDYKVDRQPFQETIAALNPRFGLETNILRPDGDVDIEMEDVIDFKIPPCPKCNGILKPDIVFFGDHIPLQRLKKIEQMLAESDGLLVLGSSLLVYSGYRIVLQALDLNIPITIVNIGPTRGDAYANCRMHGKCGDVIPKLFGTN